MRRGKRDGRVENNGDAPEVEARKVDAVPSERVDQSVGDVATIPARLRRQRGLVRRGKRDGRVRNNGDAPEVEVRKVGAVPSERVDRSVGDVPASPARLRKQWGGEKRQTRWAGQKQWRRTRG